MALESRQSSRQDALINQEIDCSGAWMELGGGICVGKKWTVSSLSSLPFV